MNKFTSKLLRFFLSSLCVGYLPLIPGTFGSLFGCVIVFLLPHFFHNFTYTLILAGFLTILALIAIRALGLEMSDPSFIVIDEVIGLFVAFAGHGVTLLILAAGFVLFRFFDIVKPFPVRQAEKIPGGFGIIADDIAAGIYTSILLFILEKFV